MVVGLLPAIRGGLGELARTGQVSRFVDGYLRRYADAFEDVRYFSYLPESLGRFVDDPAILARVRLFPAWPIHPWLYAFALAARYRRELAGCDVLRVFQVTGAIPAVIARRWLGVPFVTTYGFRYSALARTAVSRFGRRMVEHLGLRAADAVIVPTEEFRAVVARRVGDGKAHLVPNGVDTRLFRPRPHPVAGDRRILYVGRLSREKNLGALIEAAGKLRARFGLRLVLVGDGPERAKLAAAAETAGTAVDFVPVVEHRALPEVFAAADAFVLPSLTEGHPKVLLEAMSAGLPCIASAVGGNLAIVSDGTTGLLFDPRDTAALVERLERVLADDQFARALGVKARALVEERYDLGVLVSREIELLRRVAHRAETAR